MRVVVAEYAVASGMGGTFQIEGMAMLTTLVSSFERCGIEVIYPTAGPLASAGKPYFIEDESEFGDFLGSAEVDAGLVIAPDDLMPAFLDVLEKNTVNLGCSPRVASMCADKLACTNLLAERGVPVVGTVELPEQGCNLYVTKPRYGSGSEGVRISSSLKVADGYIATRYIEGLHLSVSLIAGEDRILPLTINRQLIVMDGDNIFYNGSQVPYRSPRTEEILNVACSAAKALELRGYAGIDLIVADLPRVVDVNARPTTSIIGISKVMEEELGDLMIRAMFGDLPEGVTVTGEFSFIKDDLMGKRC
jgi:predicted ATP-grasp superfamily ATP-dependent carboligase